MDFKFLKDQPVLQQVIIILISAALGSQLTLFSIGAELRHLKESMVALRADVQNLNNNQMHTEWMKRQIEAHQNKINQLDYLRSPAVERKLTEILVN